MVFFTNIRGFGLFVVLTALYLVPAEVFSQTAGAYAVDDNNYVIGREYTTENGLPGNGVNSIYQDHAGYIWAATYNGLVRYNGIRFTVFNTTNLSDLKTNRFLEIAEDRQGRIWAGMEYSSLIMIDTANDATKIYTINEDVYGPNTHVVDISFGSNGIPWIATSRGLMMLKNDELILLDHLPSQPVQNIIHTSDYTYALFETEMYRLFNDGSIDEKLIELRDDVIYTQSGRIDEFNNVVRMVDFHFIDNAIYLLHEAGLIRLEGQTSEVLLHRDEVQQGALHGFLKHGERIYVYGLNGMFAIENPGTAEEEYVYFMRQSVNDVMIDHEGSVWIATNANGLQQFIYTPIYQGPEFNVLDDYAITAVLEDNDHSIWVGTNCHGLYEFEGKEVRNYTAESGFQNTCIWSLMEQSDGTLWVGTWGGGVYYREPGSRQFERFEPQIFEGINVFLSVYEDTEGTIWFGTYENGLFRYDGTQTESIKNDKGETISAIRMFFEDEEGDLLMATDRGIGILTDDKYVIKPDDFDLLETTNFRTITKSPQGRYWFGSYGGGMVVYTPGGNFTTITIEDGLYDNTVSQLAFDNDGNLWLAGNMGIFFIEKDQIDHFLDGEIEELRVSRLGVREGMPIRETTGGFMPSSQLTEDGRFFVPTVQGLAVVDTDRMQLNRELPNILIEEIEVDGEPYLAEEINSIPHDAQRIIFRFSALSFENPEYNRYEYMVEGFDNSWQDIGNQQEAVYTGIPPGEYTLNVRASNNDGFWTSEAASVSFEVIPPFWRTTWFFMGMAVVVVVILVGGIQYRVRHIQKSNRQLQRKVEERTAELRVSNQELKKHIDEKNKLQSILAHDLRNPFSAILGYIELIKSEFKEKGDSEHVEMMNMLLDSGRNTLNLLENLLQWSGSNEGGLEADFESIDIRELVNEAVSMTDAQSAFKNIFVRNQVEDSCMVWADRNMILSVIRNLLSNAIKFSGRDSIVEISLKEEDDKVILSVEDSGVGIPEHELKKIFSSHQMQQKVGTQGEKGIGLGLQLCKDFINKHNENIWAKSTPGKGSTFSFSLKKVHEYEEKHSSSG